MKTGGRISELASTCVHKASDHVTPLRPPVVRGLWSGFALALRDLHPYGNITLYEGLIACKHGSAALLSAQTLTPPCFHITHHGKMGCSPCVRVKPCLSAQIAHPQMSRSAAPLPGSRCPPSPPRDGTCAGHPSVVYSGPRMRASREALLGSKGGHVIHPR